MNILITGGAGYIGSHVVKQLGEKTDYNLTVLDNLVTGFRSAVLYGDFIKSDLSNFDEIEGIFKARRFDAVIHFAASLIVPESVKNPLKYYLNNTANTANLIKLCVKYGVNNFVFSSTAAVYGEPDISKMPITENSLLSPINPYGMSKLMSETILRDASKAYKDFNYIALRYFNVAGAALDGKIGQSTKDATHLIKVAAETALGKRDKIYIFGDDYPTFDGTCIRDYIHVEDLSDAHLKALSFLQENKKSDIFNCGYGHGFSVKEVVNTMKEVSGVDFKVEITKRREGDPAVLIAGNKKIKEKLNWTPKYDDLKLICKSALEWEKKI